MVSLVQMLYKRLKSGKEIRDSSKQSCYYLLFEESVLKSLKI